MLRNEKGQEVHQNSVNGFSKIFLFAANETFWDHKWHVFLDLLPPPPPPNPNDEKLKDLWKEFSAKKSGENYQEIIPQIEKTVDLRRHTFENSLQQWPQEGPLKMKRANRYMKTLLKGTVHENCIKNFLNKKSYCLRQMDHFPPKTPL